MGVKKKDSRPGMGIAGILIPMGKSTFLLGKLGLIYWLGKLGLIIIKVSFVN